MADEKHTGVEREIDKAQDAVGAAVGKASASVGGGSTGAFIKNAALGDEYEIRAGEIALARSSSDKIRTMAQQMIDDHSQASAKLESVVQTLPDHEAPAELDERRKGFLDNLEAAPADEFDKTYVDQQLAAHKEAVTLFRHYVDDGDQPAVKGFAADTLPVLERHLQNVEQVHGAM